MTAASVGQTSDDGLWTWDGKRWIHVQRVGIACARCGNVVSAEQGKKEFRCSAGHRQDLIACKACRGTFQRPTETRQYDIRCPHCGYSSLYVSTCTAWEWAVDQSARGLWPPGGTGEVDADRRVLRDFTLQASAGTLIPTGSSCVIDFSSDGARITSSGVEEFVPYADIHALQIGGSTTHSTAGVFGGGFGVAGAAEGMLAASVINSLTSKTTVYSLVRLAARAAEYVFVSHVVDSGSLDMMLTPVQFRIRHAQAAPSSSPTPATSVADELAKLAQLRDAGVLSDAEFTAAKARLLGVA
jgi:DNA-directed RNA polymerase subunit RPC12/RpoP